MKKNIKQRLEYLRGEIEKECISQSEILELQSLAKHIEPGDMLLLEWAGVPEKTNTPPEDCPNCSGQREWASLNPKVAVCHFCGMKTKG